MQVGSYRRRDIREGLRTAAHDSTPPARIVIRIEILASPGQNAGARRRSQASIVLHISAAEREDVRVDQVHGPHDRAREDRRPSNTGTGQLE